MLGRVFVSVNFLYGPPLRRLMTTPMGRAGPSRSLDGRCERRADAFLAELLEAVQVVSPVEVVRAIDLIRELTRVILEEHQQRLALPFLERERERVVAPILVTRDAHPLHPIVAIEA